MDSEILNCIELYIDEEIIELIFQSMNHSINDLN